MLEILNNIDTRLFLFLNGLHNETFDIIMVWISGKTTWWPFYLVLLGIIGYFKRWQLVVAILFIALSVTLTDQTSVHLFKNVFMRLRPCHEPGLEGLVHIVNGKCGGQYGFISSHSSNVFGVAMLLSLYIRRWWFMVVIMLWALVVGYSRVYLGVHYPADVIVGMAWGLLCGWAMFRLFKLIVRKIPKNWWISNQLRFDY